MGKTTAPIIPGKGPLGPHFPNDLHPGWKKPRVLRRRKSAPNPSASPYPQNKYAIPIAATNPARSAINPQATAWRVLRIPTDPKYTAST